MKHILIWVAMLTLGTLFAQKTVEFKEGSLKWEAKKVTGSHNGTLKLKSGQMETDKAGNLIKGEFVVDMSSIEVLDLKAGSGSHTKLVNHLKSDDFFSVEKFSESKLVVDKVEKAKDGKSLFKGNITIKGITKPIEFPVEVENGKKGVEIESEFKVDRTQFDIRYNSGKFFPNIGDKMIYDDFTIQFELKGK